MLNLLVLPFRLRFLIHRSIKKSVSRSGLTDFIYVNDLFLAVFFQIYDVLLQFGF